MDQEDTATEATAVPEAVPTKVKSRPSETLPTDRIAFAKQLNLLIAYAAIYEQTGRAVTNDEAGEVVGLSAGTTSLANAFFADVGFLARADGGYVPSSEVISFRRVQEWDPDEAAMELAPLVSGTWFAQALLPKLALGPLSEQVALTELSKRAGASTQYRGQLRTLLDYLVAAGVVAQEGDQLRRVGSRPKKEAPEEPKPNLLLAESTLHPFIQGLLQELPPVQSVWPQEAQEAWLEGWKVALGFLYKTGDADAAAGRQTITPDSGRGDSD